jgi:hypothetical protein
MRALAPYAFLALLLLSSCALDLDAFGVVMGTVAGPDGLGVADVAVSVGEATTATNGQGFFVLDELAGLDRAVVTLHKSGFTTATEIVQVRTGEANWLQAVLTPFADRFRLPAADGGVVTTDSGASVTMPPGFAMGADGATEAGDVDVVVTTLDPSTAAGLAALPGEFLGTDELGTEGLLQVYGVVDIQLLDPTSGATVDRAPGTTFEVSIPVPAAMQADAPAELPLWFFDAAEGRWYEESTATFDGTHCSGTVPHLSFWACGVQPERSWVTGRVVDCDAEDAPVRGARVTAEGGPGWSSEVSSTGEDGTFRLPVVAGQDASVWPSKHAEHGARIAFAAAAVDGSHDVGDLCLDVPPVIIALVWNGEPRDLDSHLSVPTDPREHLYFNNRPISIAELDTDDTDGYGPEIVTLHELPRGTYRYSVHHYAGNSDMSEEGAKALMLVEGQGIWRETPPSGGQGLNDVWQVWDFGTRNDAVNWVRPQRRIVASTGATDLSAFDPTESRTVDSSSLISNEPEDFGF